MLAAQRLPYLCRRIATVQFTVAAASRSWQDKATCCEGSTDFYFSKYIPRFAKYISLGVMRQGENYVKNAFLGFGLSVLLAGCVSMEATKAIAISDREICIVDNSRVRQDFRDAYEQRIRDKGYKTRIVNDTAACKITSTYTARYGNHWGTYLAMAELKIFSDNKLIGQAKYKAPYASPEKHGRVENKIESMVAELLP